MDSKVNVKIYGQEYVISGEKPREQIVKVAAYVDGRMHEIANAAPSCSVSDLAVLSAVNIADESFDSKDEVEELKKLNVQLEKDAQHYVQLWDESKKNYMDYKEETQAIVVQRDDLLNEIRQKEAEAQQLHEAVNNARQQAQSSMEEVVREVEDKCKELENSFFDLQMENLQLKKELEKYKNING